MKIKINETQYKLLKELSPHSLGVKDFIEKVQSADGLLRHLGFTSLKSLKDYIQDGDGDDFQELKDEVSEFEAKNKKD